MIQLVVDDREIQAEEGKTLLQACLDNGIYIPNLCYLRGMDKPPASCRMCFVEIEGEMEPVLSCTVKVRNEMIVRTDTPAVRRLQRSGLRLLLSAHDVDCAHCPANRNCELQRIAKFLKMGLKQKRFDQVLKIPPVVKDHPFLDYYPNRCVLCGRCVFTCESLHKRPFLNFAKRGFDTTITFFGAETITKPPCEGEPACVEVCPVGALVLKDKGDGTC